MKLQLALDILTLQQALALVEAVRNSIDRIELGTPFLLEYGMEAVRQMRALTVRTRQAEISVAGGISQSTAARYCAEKPDVLIVGGGISSAPDPISAARCHIEILHT